jgi:hypothetical protein
MWLENRRYDLSVETQEMESAQESSSLARNQEAEGDFGILPTKASR